MIEHDDWERIDGLFDAALDLPPAERARYLDDNCPDPATRARVERLLAHAEDTETGLRPGGALDGGIAEAIAAAAAGAQAAPDAMEPIPGYRPIRPIGRGGMGEVWLAEQEGPVRREVAVKLVKAGMDTREVVARFQSERQALALMSHPCIARVYDAGATAAGRPYFVMEHVEGRPITEYCDARRLGTHERLELFLRVCAGIQHAHQKGIVHRDIKPSNVLVSEDGGVPLPKIIDFGIARAVDAGLDDTAVLTALGQIVGTPEYMSPEQASMRGVDVDTRTDVYSLGVLLYELLVGVRPLESDDLRAAAIDEILRRVRETDPPRPSARLTTLGAASRTLAASRGTDPAGLARRLRRDLDWIVMKALSKERERRYGSPGAMADDIRRHLRDEPVEAGPPSAAYRLRKMVRRHRVAVGAGALVAVALVGGVVAASWQAVRARRAEREAVREARASREIADFLIGLFEVSDPGTARGENVTARELLEAGGRRVAHDLAGQPDVRARVMGVVGDIDRRLGLYDAARPLLEEALRVQVARSGEDDPATAGAVLRLARLEADAGDDAAAAPLLERARGIYERTLGPGAPEVADVVQDLADLAEREGRYPEAEALHAEALAMRRAAFGDADVRVAGSLSGLATVYGRTGRHEEAERAYREALAIREAALGPDHPDLIYNLASLAALLGAVGRHEESLEANLRALAITEKVHGPDHRATASSLANLAACYGRLGRLEDVLATEARALAIKERIFGPDHVEVGKSLKNVGQANALLGHLDEAERALVRALAIDRAQLDPGHFMVGWDLAALGRLYDRQGRQDVAVARFEEAAAIFEAAVGIAHPEYVRAVGGRAKALAGLGRPAEAEAAWRDAARIVEERFPDGSPETAWVDNGLGEVVLARGRAAEARALQERSLEVHRTRFRPEHPVIGVVLKDLADAEAADAATAEAEAHYLEALAIAERAHGPEHPEVAAALLGIGRLRAREGRTEEAVADLERAVAVLSALLGERHPETREAAEALARARGR